MDVEAPMLETQGPELGMARVQSRVETSTNDAEQRFLDALPLVNQIVKSLLRGGRLPDDDVENFRSLALTKLIDDDYRVFRQFRGGCSLRTYLLVVLRRVLLDYRSQQWGKWRSSQAAKRQGTLAIRLEQLVGRDGLTFREAVSALRTNFGVEDSTTVLQELVGQFPDRNRARIEGTDVLPEVQDRAPLPDDVLIQKQARAQISLVRRQLQAALSALPAQERRIVKMRFVDAMPVVEIAQAIGCDAKSLYRDIERILAKVRRAMHGRGIDKTCARIAF
jgi:RNA polymerase sigma factor (sigma-70 family)